MPNATKIVKNNDINKVQYQMKKIIDKATKMQSMKRKTYK